ncbi:MAG TPA: STAS domain-containing protein [Nakamurella sp.]
MPFSVAVVPSPDQVVVRLTGDADLSTSAQVSEALNRSAQLGTPRVVVDVAAAHLWDLSTLHALVAFTGELAAAGRSCRIVGALSPTRRLIRLARLSDRLVLDGPVPSPARRPTGRPRAGVPARRPVSEHPVPPRGPLVVPIGRPSQQ